jgi:creatinine amidohydrolase
MNNSVETSTELDLEYMTCEDVRDRINDGYKTVIFAVGSIEQHGPHLPVTTDALRGTASARLVAAELGKSLVAPTIRPGYSPHHMEFPGTITLQQETLASVIKDYCTSLAEHGFETIVVVTAHGGNDHVIKTACYDVHEMLEDQVLVIPITGLLAYYDGEYDEHLEGYHGGRLETSFMLNLAPELVHMDRAQEWENPISDEIKEAGTVLQLAGTKRLAPHGSPGRATAAEAEVGQEVLRNIARNVAKQVHLLKSFLKA